MSTNQLWDKHGIGDRVRFITDESSTGVIVSAASESPHGGLRQGVRWDRSGVVSAWNPVFLVPIDYDDEDIPDRVTDESGYTFDKATNTLSPPKLKRSVEATILPHGQSLIRIGNR